MMKENSTISITELRTKNNMVRGNETPLPVSRIYNYLRTSINCSAWIMSTCSKLLLLRPPLGLSQSGPISGMVFISKYIEYGKCSEISNTLLHTLLAKNSSRKHADII